MLSSLLFKSSHIRVSLNPLYWHSIIAHSLYTLKTVFFPGDLSSNCTRIMGLAPSPWNINCKLLVEIAKKFRLMKNIGWNRQILDESKIMDMWYVLIWYFLSNMWMNIEIWNTTITFNIATLTLYKKWKNKFPKDLPCCGHNMKVSTRASVALRSLFVPQGNVIRDGWVCTSYMKFRFGNN